MPKDPEQKITRPPVKNRAIVGALKREILEGLYPPGARLPTRSELETRFSVSRITVQLAMDRLRREGFVAANGRQGTVVVDHPPHLFHYGVVFCGHPAEPITPWVRFWTAIENEARAISSTGPRRLSIYYKVELHSDVEDYRRLLSDMQNQRLAGVIFVSVPLQTIKTLTSAAPDVPCVIVSSKPGGPKLPAVTTGKGFMQRALDHLAQRGRKRIALLNTPGVSQNSTVDVDAELAERGMFSPRHWNLLLSPMLPESARNCADLLVRGDGVNRPDGLVIVDDNLVEHASAGLVSSGVRIPEDLDVVAHCNFPWPAPSIVPVRRLGYDARELVDCCLQVLDTQRLWRVPPALTEVPVLFEDEVAPVRRPQASGALAVTV